MKSSIWLRRLARAAATGIAIGLLAYVIARGVAGAALLGQQQALLGSMTGVIGNLDSPPDVDLHAARKVIQILDIQYAQISTLIGIAVGTIAAVIAYLRLESRVR